jgi:hypothetical protein
VDGIVPAVLPLLAGAAAGGWGLALAAAVVLQACYLAGTFVGLLATREQPAQWADLLLLAAAGAAADFLVLRDSHANAGSLAMVVALGFVVALIRQLSRSERDGLTAQLAVAAAGLAAVTLPAVLVVLSRTEVGQAAAVTAGAAAAAGLLVGTGAVRLMRQVPLAVGAAALAAVGVSLLCGGVQGTLSLLQGLAVGAAAALTAALVRVSRGSGLGVIEGTHQAAWWCLPAIWVLPVALLVGRLLVR